MYSTAGGLIDEYSKHPVNGNIKKFSYVNGNQTNGSLFITVSGTGEAILTQTAVSGGTTKAFYPRTNITATNGSLLTGISGNTWGDLAVSDVIHFVGSGLGATKYLTNVRIDYM